MVQAKLQGGGGVCKSSPVRTAKRAESLKKEVSIKGTVGESGSDTLTHSTGGPQLTLIFGF